MASKPMEIAYEREMIAAHRLAARAVLHMLRIIKREGAPSWTAQDRDNMIEQLKHHRYWLHNCQRKLIELGA